MQGIEWNRFEQICIVSTLDSGAEKILRCYGAPNLNDTVQKPLTVQILLSESGFQLSWNRSNQQSSNAWLLSFRSDKLHSKTKITANETSAFVPSDKPCYRHDFLIVAENSDNQHEILAVGDNSKSKLLQKCFLAATMRFVYTC
ncbi:hypothetical protein P879_03948 [Paragonimus westermani]|uniref:Uncharacterized protein n=1 Tax=Paragonimus westermani TaxID=34504 RepID=A0A8T0DCI2_9TREM|nr:hypothetical protein P879_03948 [Paragonimus westermani]